MKALNNLRRASCWTCSRVSSGVVLIAFVLFAFVLAQGDSWAQDQLDEKERETIRRAYRRAKQKDVEKAMRKDFSRDTSRLDHKIDSATAKVTDTKIRDQKDLSAEVRREREEAKLAAEKLRRYDREPAETRMRIQELLMQKDKRIFFELR